VKRYSGDNSWGVAPCEDSSLPGLILKDKSPSEHSEGLFVVVKLEGFEQIIIL
jgi:hypothetical protein